jgi:hypothetical protein
MWEIGFYPLGSSDGVDPTDQLSFGKQDFP